VIVTMPDRTSEREPALLIECSRRAHAPIARRDRRAALGGGGRIAVTLWIDRGYARGSHGLPAAPPRHARSPAPRRGARDRAPRRVRRFPRQPRLRSAPLRYRPVLAHRAYAANMPEHPFTPSGGAQSYMCAVCGASEAIEIGEGARRRAVPRAALLATRAPRSRGPRALRARHARAARARSGSSGSRRSARDSPSRGRAAQPSLPPLRAARLSGSPHPRSSSKAYAELARRWLSRRRRLRRPRVPRTSRSRTR
jgi:hypothetical protein